MPDHDTRKRHRSDTQLDTAREALSEVLDNRRRKRQRSQLSPKSQTTRRTHGRPVTPRRTRAAAPFEASEPDEPMLVTEAVANKIDQVKMFRQQAKSDLLKHDRDNPKLVEVTEAMLSGVCSIMRAHYQIRPEPLGSLTGVSECVVGRFIGRIGQNNAIPHLTIDLSKKTSLEKEIDRKVRGHGLEGVCLLEVELSLYRQDEVACMLGIEKGIARSSLESFDDRVRRVSGNVRVESTKGHTDDILGSTKLVSRHQGVCMRPLMDFV